MSSIKKEAERCLKCKNPMCSANCPVGTAVPEVMQLFLDGEIGKAGESSVSGDVHHLPP